MNANSIIKISKVVVELDNIFRNLQSLCLGCAEPSDIKSIDWEIKLSQSLGSSGVNLSQLVAKLGGAYYLDGENIMRWKGGCQLPHPHGCGS